MTCIIPLKWRCDAFTRMRADESWRRHFTPRLWEAWVRGGSAVPAPLEPVSPGALGAAHFLGLLRSTCRKVWLRELRRILEFRHVLTCDYFWGKKIEVNSCFRLHNLLPFWNFWNVACFLSLSLFFLLNKGKLNLRYNNTWYAQSRFKNLPFVPNKTPFFCSFFYISTI